MKVICLTYDYDLNKLSEIGRTWASSVYGGKEYIFEYSAASYATFIDKNPNVLLHAYTDDIDFLKEKLSKYNIDQDRIIYYDFKEKLDELRPNLKYSFDILTEFIYYAKSKDEYTLKIDNDLIFHSALPEINDSDISVWKYERLVSQGNPLMGEIKVAQESIGTTNFPIYNLGIFGLPVNYPELELREISEKMVNVDISDVTDLDTKIWHCCEQTANNWIFHKYQYKIKELYPYVTHYFDNKQRCIVEANYLIKK